MKIGDGKSFTGIQVYLSHPFLSVVKKNLGIPEKNIDSKLK